MIHIWGRANSVNVQKVLWCCAELGLPYDRTDAGMQYGRVRDPDYLAMNPNGRVPTLVDGDFVLWESNSIMRYLCLEYGGTALYPAPSRQRAGVDRWLDWTLSTLQPAERDVFWGYVRTEPAKRDMAKIDAGVEAVTALWRLLDTHLADRRFVEAEAFTIADLALGCYARRWFGIAEISRPPLPAIERWYDRLQEREGFRRWVAPPLT